MSTRLKDLIPMPICDAAQESIRFFGIKEFEMLDASGRVLVFGQETDDSPTPA